MATVQSSLGQSSLGQVKHDYQFWQVKESSTKFSQVQFSAVRFRQGQLTSILLRTEGEGESEGEVVVSALESQK